jgi:hypothetical protein
MWQRLLITVLVAVLFLSGWGGVLASAMCWHAGAPAGASADDSVTEAPADCCPTGAGESTHCPMSKAQTGARRRDTSAASAVHQAASHEATPVEAASPLDATHALSAATRRQASGSPLHPCVFCPARSESPPAPVAAPAPDGARRDAAAHAPRANRLPAAPRVSFAPAVIPSQGAPPGLGRTRHLLHSVFLI